MQYGDLNRERRIKNKGGWHTDKAIIGGAKKVAKAVVSAPQKASNKVLKATYKLIDKAAGKVVKSKWWRGY